jgi:hypothetical protein
VAHRLGARVDVEGGQAVRREFRERWPMLDRDAIDALVS